jgi:hypothetical protein
MMNLGGNGFSHKIGSVQNYYNNNQNPWSESASELQEMLKYAQLKIKATDATRCMV